VPSNCRLSKPGEFLAVRKRNWIGIQDKADDDADWVDPGVLIAGKCYRGNANFTEYSEGQEDIQGSENSTGKWKGTNEGKMKWKDTEDGWGSGRGSRSHTVKGKEFWNKPQGQMISLGPLFCSWGRKWLRQSKTQRANWGGYIVSQNHRLQCQFPQMLIRTRPRSQTATITQNRILLGICTWRMMCINWTVVI